jgi:aspartate carbamoyltransferase catalytic subunit
MKIQLSGRNLISMADLSKEEILHILKSAEEMKRTPPAAPLRGKILASCFFEPSTRTRLSFESAMIRLGGNTIGFFDAASTSTKKGETLHDSMKVMGSYADILVVRHPSEGAARLASHATHKPIINAGDGANQHPTQALTDLMTIKESQGALKGLSVALIGDLKHGRTVHSLAIACAHFDMRLFFVSPEPLCLPEETTQTLKRQGVKFSFHRTVEEIVPKADILYMTRLQKERFEPDLYEQLKESYRLTPATLEKAPKHLKILHPLPRMSEIDVSVDRTPHAAYFDQAENGLYTRMALLFLILN